MNLQAYLDLPYTKTLRKDEEGDFVARVAELPGCVAHGATEAEALAALDDAQRLWLEDAIEAGDPIPKPEADDDTLPSGKWLQRVPRSLHQSLARIAKLDGVSLNQLVTSFLAEAVGRRFAVETTTMEVRPAHLQADMTNVGVVRLHGHLKQAVEVVGWNVAVDEWQGPAQPFSNHALMYLDSTVKCLPDRIQVSDQELHDVYEWSVRGVSKKRSASHYRPQFVHGKD